MASNLKPLRTLALFCKVVDNYGDIGICWRLARQLAQEHGITVSLWVDDLVSFQKICPEVSTHEAMQMVSGINVIHWHHQDGDFSPEQIADIVIEFFGCDIPPGYIRGMAGCIPHPVWLNLEGLSAEEWVEGCHCLPSPHPSSSLVKHFFFPGFTEKTGGLLIESGLEQARQDFLAHPQTRHQFLSALKLSEHEMSSQIVSLFCYPDAPVSSLFSVWEQANAPITCLVPEGVAKEAVERFLGQAANAGTTASRGALTVRVLPFIPQPDYDKLLWACDLNFVRGEDSFVRAQLAGKPFIWHIYPQDENLHHVKLKAFLNRYAGELDSIRALSFAWNHVESENLDWPAIWSQYSAEIKETEKLAEQWRQKIRENGDMTSNLLHFAASVHASKSAK